MKKLIMLFSPFDALGLAWGIYDSTAITRAYRRAALVCHPDKRKQHGIPLHRWPYVWQLAAARDYISSATVEELEKFKTFPRTFFPDDPTSLFVDSQQLSDQFKQCDICGVVVLSTHFADHLGEHKLKICAECDERVQEDAFSDHQERVHGHRRCCYCQTVRTPEEHEGHFTNNHQCPLCDEDVAILVNHLQEVHRFRPCTDCSGINPVIHVVTEHPASKCPGCADSVFDDILLDHLMEDHGLRPCELCYDLDTATELDSHLQTDHDFNCCQLCMKLFDGDHILDAHLALIHDIRRCTSCPCGEFFDMEHVAARHATETCPECKIFYQEGLHLVVHHNWIPCGVCSLASPNAQASWKHADSHPLCEHCDKQMMEEHLQRHLQDMHGLLCCPLCNIVSPSADLPRHFQTTHNQTESCTDCGYTGTEGGLRLHAIQVHMWLQCGFCDEAFHDIGRKTSHEEDVHGTQPCWHCDQVIPERQMRSHQIKDHGYEACPLCPSLSKELSSHILSHRQGSESTNHQLSEINKQLQRLATLERSALIRQAAEYIEQAISVEKQDSAARQPRLSSSKEAPHTSRHSNAPLSTPVQQPPFVDETVVLQKSSAVTEQSFHRDSAEDNNRRRSNRHQTGCKRPPQYNLGPENPPHKKSKRSVVRKTGLSDILEKVTCLRTVRGFIEVVTSNHRLDPLQLRELRHENQSDYGLLSLISQFADKCEHQVGLTKIWHYYALWQMSQLVDRAKKVAGRQRVDSAELDKILEHKQCGTTDYNRNKLRNQLQLGRRLQKISGQFTGLLCFIAIGQADIGKSLSFTEGDLNRFHVSIGAYRNLWEAGGRYLNLSHVGTTQDADELREITGLVNTAIPIQ